MKYKENKAFWKPDKATLDKIQELNKFISFIENFDSLTSEDRTKLIEIKFLIENIDKLETYKYWNISLDIFDRSLQGGNGKEGVFWRYWNIYFENDMLEISALSKHTTEYLGHYGNDFSYSGVIHFDEVIKGKRIYFDDDIGEFIKDAINYKKYITETLNSIEIDIDVSEI